LGWQVTPDKAASGLALVEVPEEQVHNPVGMLGWTGPPWIKEGWYEAWQLLVPGLPEATRSQAQALAGRLMRGDVEGRVEAFNLERRLVDVLMQPCLRVPVGYVLRQEYVNNEYAFGVENIAPDALSGLNNPIFVRTVKLKDFPWNGSFLAAAAVAPRSAWNPVAGFSDPAGRFVWSVISDTAYMSAPDSESWIPNRMDPLKTTVQQTRTATIAVPPEALLPEAGTGILRPVGPGKKSQARVTYRVLSSPFIDGMDTEVEDLLYAYAFAFRWGGGKGDLHDPAVAAATALLRERLMGIRVVGTQRFVDDQAGVPVPKVVHTIEVFLNHASADPQQVAALAPPWSNVPWQLLALMEEAVARGVAAFSEDEARRRGVPWLDLARDPQMLGRLDELIAEFERTQFRPPAMAAAALSAIVTPENAAKRWAALAAFRKEHGHLLDTNGAYVLKSVKADQFTFDVVRDFRYAIGLGTFNALADAPSARVTGLQQSGKLIYFWAELELPRHVQRDTVVSRAPLLQGAARGFIAITPRARLLVIGPDGKVVASRIPKWQQDGRFLASLPEALTSGKYTVAAAVYVDGNTARAGTATASIDVR
jgi:hypothetical protein